jgi:hypothetical protein
LGWCSYSKKPKYKTINPNTFPTFHIYQNKKSKYEIDIPDGWYIAESTEGGIFTSRIVWSDTQAGVNLGNISQLSVTIIASPSAKQTMSTQKEFDEWYSMNNGSTATDSGIIKVDNVIISGQKSVTMKEEENIENDIQNSFFSRTSWFRVEKTNYYINIMGNGLFTETEKKYFNEILSSFKMHP